MRVSGSIERFARARLGARERDAIVRDSSESTSSTDDGDGRRGWTGAFDARSTGAFDAP